MIVSGYSLELYCDTEPRCPHQGFTSPQASFCDENKTRAWSDARKAGWKLDGKTSPWTATCPGCVKDQKAVKKAEKGKTS